MKREPKLPLSVGCALALVMLAGGAWLAWRPSARLPETAVWVAPTPAAPANWNRLLGACTKATWRGPARVGRLL